MVLKELDPGTEIVNTGRTAAQELAMALAEKRRMNQFMLTLPPAAAYLRTAPLEVQVEYAGRMMTDGELAAMRYLMVEMAKANH